MKKWIGVALCLVPLAVQAEQRYTNEDLRKFSVPGAYTNQDLQKLPKLPVAKAVPVVPIPIIAVEPGPFQMQLDFLQQQRLGLQSELDYREGMLEKAYSYFDKAPNEGPYPGYLSKSVGILNYLEMQLAITDSQIENLLDGARRAGVVLENR
jgi:hypothetical protein